MNSLTLAEACYQVAFGLAGTLFANLIRLHSLCFWRIDLTHSRYPILSRKTYYPIAELNEAVAPFVLEHHELLRLPRQPDDHTLRDSDNRRLRLRVRSLATLEDLAEADSAASEPFNPRKTRHL